MIHASLEKDTRHYIYNGKAYCAYCGKEILPDSGIDHYDRIDYFHCDCENAIKELNIYEEIKKLNKKINELSQNIPDAVYSKHHRKGMKWYVDTLKMEVSNINSDEQNTILFNSKEEAETALKKIIKVLSNPND